MTTSERLDLLDVLSSGDGQEWADLYENSGQQQIAETMYGKQADQLLASSWLADRIAAAVLRGEKTGREAAGLREVWDIAWDGDPAMGGGYHTNRAGREFRSLAEALTAAQRTRIDRRPGFRIESRLTGAWARAGGGEHAE